MRIHQVLAAAAAVALSGSTGAEAYPGGTPNYQTDIAPYCASCHSSLSAESLAGVGERADMEVAERKHIAVILAGEKGYASLGEADRQTLAEQIRSLDVASSVTMTAPPTVVMGQTFDVTVQVTGGAGPVVGVALVDANHRWYARPASSVGFVTVAPPDVEGPDGNPQVEWLSKRPESQQRNVSYVNVTGIASDSAAKQWASARVTFHLRVSDRPGSYPLTAVYLYGTEKSSVLGYTTNPVGWKEVRGGVGGGSGRVMFTPVQHVTVVSPE